MTKARTIEFVKKGAMGKPPLKCSVDKSLYITGTCGRDGCMWSSKIESSGCILNGKEPDYNIEMEELAKHKGVTVEKANKLKAIGRKRIKNLLILDKYIHSLAVLPMNFGILSVCQKPAIEEILAPIYNSPVLVTPLHKDSYTLVTMLDKKQFNLFIKSCKLSSKLNTILELSTEELATIRKQISQLTKENEHG